MCRWPNREMPRCPQMSGFGVFLVGRDLSKTAASDSMPDYVDHDLGPFPSFAVAFLGRNEIIFSRIL